MDLGTSILINAEQVTAPLVIKIGGKKGRLFDMDWFNAYYRVHHVGIVRVPARTYFKRLRLEEGWFFHSKHGWIRDSLKESLDSMKVIHDGKMSYSYQPYKEE